MPQIYYRMYAGYLRPRLQFFSGRLLFEILLSEFSNFTSKKCDLYSRAACNKEWPLFLNAQHMVGLSCSVTELGIQRAIIELSNETHTIIGEAGPKTFLA